MAKIKSYVFKIASSIILLFLLCEFIIYYVVLLQCRWPDLDEKRADDSIRNDGKELKALLLADTHLLGPRRGHWLDKLRREWQMYRTFQTAMTIHRPDVVFILGDIFDEGLWCSDAEFKTYVERFKSLFYVPTGTKLYVVVGNHDIGFHYGISPYLHKRFTDAFNAPSVRMLTIEGNHFVLINSMAMEGDRCFLCRPAEIQIGNIAKKLKCARGSGPCPKSVDIKQYSRPILLQHFPLYRESDEGCNEIDEAPEDEKRQKFRERWECLSKESSYMLLETLNPRLVITGHTHHGCRRYHDGYDTHEFTIPSFSWRNKDNPSFMLVTFDVATFFLPFSV
ncbi:metallophosphoesterase 1 isoform X2 [Cimex lectularius]|uniref:Metallophosphoesterase 1 homolog n=1 Tax=Cimex lectularius TaxID=79782 RepID=A0A8I6SA08_CIMLE|nr:metallophosphoesterase 1 isoform X2 [Cimex lectularius]